MDYTKRYSDQQEKRIAKTLGGKVQPGSGALPVASLKGDVSIKESFFKILIDGKTTMNKTYQSGLREKGIKKDWITKIKQEAFDGGYDMGVIAFSFDNKKDYYILEDVDFRNIMQTIDDLQFEINKLKEIKK